jgi:hypothetical protein
VARHQGLLLQAAAAPWRLQGQLAERLALLLWVLLLLVWVLLLLLLVSLQVSQLSVWQVRLLPLPLQSL